MKHFDFRKSYWFPVIIPVFFFLLYFIVKHNFQLLHGPGIDGGDEPSYVLFNFSSFKAIFDQHRTFGLPLLVKAYSLFFGDFRMWPHFYMVLFLMSTLYLYWAFIKFGFDKILSTIVVMFVLWHKSVFAGFNEIKTEPLVVICLNLILGTLLFTLMRRTWKRYCLLGFFIFYLYQVRPNFSYVAVLVPLWALGMMVLMKKFETPAIIKEFFRIAAVSMLPLLGVCVLRLFLVGQFGLVSIAGGCLSGHATHYLNESTIKLLSGDSRQIAEEILKRKRQLSFPANLSPFSESIVPDLSRYSESTVPAMTMSDVETACFGRDMMTAWLVAIHYLTGQEVFHDPSKNREPEQYVQTLSYFYTQFYTTQTDKLLMKYSSDIVKIEWKRYLRWLFGGSIIGIRDYINAHLLWWWLFLLLGIFSTQYLLKHGPLEKAQCEQWRRGVLFMAMVGISLFVVGYFPIIITLYPVGRSVAILTVYFLPAITLLLLPPFWLKERNRQ